jgi:hypothetical protein
MPIRKKNPADRVQSRGTKRMKERGCKQVVVWLDPRELALIAAAAGSRKLATWIREKAYRAAEEQVRQRQRNEAAKP